MAQMTLSQALRHSKKLKGKLAELSARAMASVTYKGSQKPAFEFGSIMEQIQLTRRELVDLEARIGITNALTMVELDGPRRVHLTSAIRELQEQKSQIAWLKSLPCRAQASTKEREVEYTHAGHMTVDVSWTCDLPEAERAALVEQVQSFFDRLNDSVERVNHVTVLVDL